MIHEPFVKQVKTHAFRGNREYAFTHTNYYYYRLTIIFLQLIIELLRTLFMCCYKQKAVRAWKYNILFDGH